MNVHIVVSGRVQGVGFRFATKQKAMEYGLNGWVRNVDDGTVEIEIEGDEAKVKLFLANLKKGFHPFIRVDQTEIKISPSLKGFRKFEII